MRGFGPVQWSAAPRSKLLRSTSPGRAAVPCSTITALGQPMAMHGAASLRAACRSGCRNKKARNLAVSGPLLESAWEMRAYALPPPGGT
jgi:hypothetical protein